MNFFQTYISPRAKDRICRLLDSGWLNEGKQVQRFEKKLNLLLDLPNILTTNSCSSALLICLLDIDVKNREVILPSQTFIATGLAILAAGGIPVFCDIDPNTGNLAPESILGALNDKTKAIIPVHWAGNPCDLEKIAEIAKKHDLKVIQDAAHALGAIWNKKSIAHFGDYTCFSFQAIKHLTSSDGGAISTPTPNPKLKKMKWFGIDKNNILRDECGGRLPNIDTFGFKWNMNDYCACLGSANLFGFRTRLKQRRKLAKIYEEHLKEIPGIKLLDLPENAESAYWMLTIRVENRAGFCQKLRDFNLPFSTVDYGIHKNPVFECKKELSGQNLFDQTQISLPVHELITSELAMKTIEIIKQGW